MERQQLLAALETEIRRHDFDCFVTEPPSIAQGGKGVVVPGCPACKKKIYTMAQFTDHLVEAYYGQIGTCVPSHKSKVPRDHS